MVGESLFQALSDVTRLRIVNFLTHGEFNVSEIVSVLDCSQSKASRHLSFLRRSGLVLDRKFHNQVLYSINTHETNIKEHLVPLVNFFCKKNDTYNDDLKRIQRVFKQSFDTSTESNRGRRVLFICEHNAARSQMAQAFLNRLGGNTFEARSAGLSPTGIHQNVIEVMKEKGYDISHQRSRNLRDFIDNNEKFDITITVFDESLLNKYPGFPGEKKRLHWNLEDPSRYFSTNKSGIEKVREICDRIEERVYSLISNEC